MIDNDPLRSHLVQWIQRTVKAFLQTNSTAKSAVLLVFGLSQSVRLFYIKTSIDKSYRQYS